MKIEKQNEYQYIIDGEWYDLRSDAKYIYECLDKQKSETKVKVEVEEEIEVEEKIEKENFEYEGWRVPMPTEKSVITDKKMDYELLGAITLISNRKTRYAIEDLLEEEEEEHRYIYEKGDNSILSNKEFLEKATGNQMVTIKRNLRKLASCNNEVVSYCEDEHGKYYKIMPYVFADNGNLQYVKIDSRILKFLIDTSSSNGIKVYCTLLWILWDKEKECYVKKQLTRDWLCKQIGLSEKSKNNLETIGNILYTFEKVGLIARDKETITVEQKGQNSIVKTVYCYTLCTVEEFLTKRKGE